MGVILVLSVIHDASQVFCSLQFDSTVADLLAPFHLNELNSPQFSIPQPTDVEPTLGGGGGEKA